jgi:HEAT repeat protein
MAELKSTTPSRQEEARGALREIGPQAVPFLIGQARHANSILKHWHREAWLRLPGTVQKLFRKPESEDEALFRISVALQPIGRPAIPAIMAALKEQNTQARSVAGLFFMRLSQDDPAAAVAGLAKMLEVPDDELRQAAAGVLGTLGTNAVPAVPRLIGTIQHDKWDYVRETAARALAALAGPELAFVAPRLVESLDDRLAPVRLWSAISLWRVNRDPRAIAVLVADLKNASGEDGTCYAIIRILGETGPSAKAAIPTIRGILEIYAPAQVLPEGADVLIEAAQDALHKIDPGEPMKID